MKISHKYFAFLIIILIPLIALGQTSIGLKGGVNWGSVRIDESQCCYEGKYQSYPSCYFGLDIKHRLNTFFGLGGSVDYYINNTQWYADFGGHNRFDHKDIRYKIGYMRFSIFPEFIIGKKFQFYCNAGPFFSLMVYSNRDGVVWNDNPINYSYEPVSGSAKEDIKTIDAGFKGCIGVGIEVGQNMAISVESAWSIGLVNISKSGYGGEKTKGISVLAGIVFVLPENNKVK